MIKLIILFLILVFIIKNTYFKENLIGMTAVTNDYEQDIDQIDQQIPVLTFQSTKDCPILYKLFKDLKDTSKRLDHTSDEETKALHTLNIINYTRTKKIELENIISELESTQGEIDSLNTSLETLINNLEIINSDINNLLVNIENISNSNTQYNIENTIPIDISNIKNKIKEIETSVLIEPQNSIPTNNILTNTELYKEIDSIIDEIQGKMQPINNNSINTNITELKKELKKFKSILNDIKEYTSLQKIVDKNKTDLENFLNDIDLNVNDNDDLLFQNIDFIIIKIEIEIELDNTIDDKNTNLDSIKSIKYTNVEKEKTKIKTDLENILLQLTLKDITLTDEELKKSIQDIIDRIENEEINIQESETEARNILKEKKQVSSEKSMERIEGLRFRNKLQSTFYNTDEIVTVEYQIIDLFKEDIDNQVKTSNDSSGNYVYTPPDIIPNFKFDYDNTNIVDYISPKDKHLEITHKESFGVKGDFTIDDLCRFSNYCFTKLTAKIVPIKDLQLNNAAMYAYKCPVCNNEDNEDNGGYNIVPVRIVQQCLKEGKEFTRAKCTHCPVNILVYFTDSPPSDYINLKYLEHKYDNNNNNNNNNVNNYPKTQNGTINLFTS